MSFKVIGIGEVLWDLLPSGPQLGGAPANFAYHAQALGARAGVVTRVGSDQLGGDIQKRLEALQLPLDLVQVDESAPTGTVSVELGSDGNPCFTIHERVSWDRRCGRHLLWKPRPARRAVSEHHPATVEPISADITSGLRRQPAPKLLLAEGD